jgi:hypothetical protein
LDMKKMMMMMMILFFHWRENNNGFALGGFNYLGANNRVILKSQAIRGRERPVSA